MDHKKNDDLPAPAYHGGAPSSRQPHNPTLAAAYERTMRETAASRKVPLLSRLALLALVGVLVYYALKLQYTTRKMTGRWDEYDWGTGTFEGQDANMEGFEQYMDGQYDPARAP